MHRVYNLRPRFLMNARTIIAFVLVLLASVCQLSADEPKPPRLTDFQRQMILRELMAELVYVIKPLPMGKVGLKIENGNVAPTDAEIQQLVADFGAAAKPGERVRITDVRFTKQGIVFDINGGLTKKKKWYERMELGMGTGGTVTGAGKPGSDARDLYKVAQGSSVILYFKDYIPALRPEQVKEMLAPVFDFNARSIAEAYQRSLPPKLAEAVKNQRALVGMDREMVGHAKGRPPRRVRESEDGVEYEEWIYGQPPNDVEFIRFVGDKVVRISTMAVDGKKTVRMEDEVGPLTGQVAQSGPGAPGQPQQPAERPAPSLRRPGDDKIDVQPTSRPKDPLPQADPNSDGDGLPGGVGQPSPPR